MRKHLLILTTFIVLLLTSCKEKKSNVFDEKGFTVLKGAVFGTTYYIKYLDKNSYQKSIDSLFERFNKSLSTYKTDSDISKI